LALLDEGNVYNPLNASFLETLVWDLFGGTQPVKGFERGSLEHVLRILKKRLVGKCCIKQRLCGIYFYFMG
jgi:hypothetical protein